MSGRNTSRGVHSHNNRRAFTLIELLVVIAIIALLMAILIPTFQRVSREAKAVGCRSKLNQWGILFSQYLADHNGMFFPLDCDIFRPLPAEYPGYWSVRYIVTNYFPHPPSLMLCPMTPVRKADEDREHSQNYDDRYGGKFKPWCFDPVSYDERLGATMPLAPTFGSYGLNWCVRVPPPAVRHEHDPVCPYTISPGDKGGTCIYHFARQYCWRNWQPEHPARIPVFLDSTFPYAAVRNADQCGPFGDEDVPPLPGSIGPFCVNRHDGYVNGLFMDFSVRKIGLKELWTLKWNPHFDTANRWTKAGRVRPEDWPSWMWKFRDY